jgi:hypothetical protein
MSRTRRRHPSEVEFSARDGGRNVPKTGDQHDHRYDRRSDHLVKHVDPLELDTLLHEFDIDDEDPTETTDGR